MQNAWITAWGDVGSVTATLAERIAKGLRRDILRGRLRPGAPIKERDNAQDLGVSRTPMREAIRILAKEGLVELRPARSPIVANPTLTEITDSIEVLVALEELSGRLAVRHASDAEIAGIREIHDRIGREYNAMDPVDVFEIDMAFHRAIAEASHNAELARVHGDYLARMWRARFVSGRDRRSSDRVVREHGAIVDALAQRDADGTAGAIRHHLEHLLGRMVAAYQGHEDTHMNPPRSSQPVVSEQAGIDP